jgi:hypothetical protein
LFFFWFFDNKPVCLPLNKLNIIVCCSLCLKWSIVRVESFFVCQFYILLLHINHHIKMIAFFICNKGCRSKMTSISLEVLLWPQAPLSSVLGLWHSKWCLFSQSKLPNFLNHWTTVVLFWIPYFCRFCNGKLSPFNFLNKL